MISDIDSMRHIMKPLGSFVDFTSKCTFLLLVVWYEEHSKYNGFSVWNATFASKLLAFQSHVLL